MRRIQGEGKKQEKKDKKKKIKIGFTINDEEN